MSEETTKQPDEEPAQPEVDSEPEAIDGLTPLTIVEGKQLARDVGHKAKEAGLAPVRRAGRTYLQSIRKAADWFFDGLGASK